MLIVLLASWSFLSDEEEISRDDFMEVKHYLIRHHINPTAANRYATIFREEGYETKEQVTHLTRQQLGQMKVKPGHADQLELHEERAALTQKARINDSLTMSTMRASTAAAPTAKVKPTAAPTQQAKPSAAPTQQAKLTATKQKTEPTAAPMQAAVNLPSTAPAQPTVAVANSTVSNGDLHIFIGFVGGLGNAMFQFAAALGIAAQYKGKQKPKVCLLDYTLGLHQEKCGRNEFNEPIFTRMYPGMLFQTVHDRGYLRTLEQKLAVINNRSDWVFPGLSFNM